MKSLLRAAVAGVVVAGFTAAAHAAVIDFTALSTYDTHTASGATGTVYGGLVGWAVAPIPETGTLTYAGGGPGPGFSAENGGIDIDGELDGIGINDDEIGYPDQKLMLAFTEPVELTGFAVLDLFRSSGDGTVFEVAFLQTGTGSAGPGAALEALDVLGEGWGYRSTQTDNPISLIGDRFLFSVGRSNDNTGTPDYALAAVSLADDRPPQIPLPAGGLLLLTALGVLGLWRARRIRL